MTYPEYLKHAWSLYYKAVAAEGSVRASFLRQAENVLENVPDDYDNAATLRSRINDLK